MKQALLIFLLIFSSLLVSSCTPKNYSLANKTWDAYITDKMGGDTSDDYFITYTFNSNGTFTESHKSRDLSKMKQSYKKTWELINNVLIITLVRHSDGFRRTTKYPLKWLNGSTFYIVEENEVSDVKTYTYCYAR